MLFFIQDSDWSIYRHSNVKSGICFKESVLGLQSPNFLALGMGFMEDNFSMDRWKWGGFRMIWVNYIYCALCLLLLHQLHFRLSGIRSQRLRTSALGEKKFEKTFWAASVFGVSLAPLCRLPDDPCCVPSPTCEEDSLFIRLLITHEKWCQAWLAARSVVLLKPHVEQAGELVSCWPLPFEVDDCT